MKNHVTLLVDGDILAYKAAAIHQETIDFGGDEPTIVTHLSEAKTFIDDTLLEYVERLHADDYLVCLSDDFENYRKTILDSYKEHRKDTPKPVLLGRLKTHLRDHHPYKAVDLLEADDVMGILATHPKLIGGKKIIVSQDKDLLTIPGWLWNPDKHRRPIKVTKADADAYHRYQTLIGDPTDNYKGCPGIGPVKATKLLLEDDSWETVVAAYEAAGLTEEDALVQARCARILRYVDFNFKTKEPRLWTPTERS